MDPPKGRSITSTSIDSGIFPAEHKISISLIDLEITPPSFLMPSQSSSFTKLTGITTLSFVFLETL